jgi:hypothetical protein
MKNNENEKAATGKLTRQIIVSLVCILGLGLSAAVGLRALGGAGLPFKAFDQKYIPPTTQQQGDAIVMQGMNAALEKHRYKTNEWVFRRMPDVRGMEAPGLMEQVLTNHQLIFELSKKSNPKQKCTVTVLRPNSVNILHFRIAQKE